MVTPTPTTVQVKIQLRGDTATNWAAVNPVLLTNELGLETDTKKIKVGNGSTAWNSLAYFPSIVTGGTVLGNLEIGTTGTLTFEGSTADGFETTLAVTDPTADRTITLPDQTGTVIVSGNASIVNADIAANAEIAVSKLANGTVNQVLVTDGTDVSWSDDLTLAGNLTVNGTTTTVNTETLTVKDKNIELAVVDTPTDVTADGGGITLQGATNKTITWIDTTDAWTFNQVVDLPAGTNTLPALFFNGDVDTGIYSPGDNQLAISTSGTQRVNFGTGEVVFNETGENYDLRIEGDTQANLVFVDASTDQVGLGTNSPSAPLHIEDSQTDGLTNTGLIVSSFQPRIILNDRSESEEYVDIRNDSGALIIGYGPKDTYATRTGEYARIDSSGRLLVGTPTGYLTSTSATTQPLLQIHSTNTHEAQVSINSWATGTATGANLSLCRSDSGTVGTHIAVGSADTLGSVRFSGSDGDQFIEGASIVASADGTWGNDDGPTKLVFSVTPDSGSSPTTSPSAMTINSGQEVLIGYSSDNGAYKLQVNSQIFATSATIATSDGRYKENVSTLGGCLDLVKALRPVSFTWKPQQAITRIDDEGEEVVVREPHNFPEGTQVGFIAQEVQEVLDGKPWLGSVIKENIRPAVKDNDGNELAPEEQFYGIAEGNLIAVLTNALQEAVGRIEALEAEVAALKA